MDIIFLDIDGVLNNDSLWALLPEDHLWFQIFPQNMEFFLRAVRIVRERRELSVVMSTSWRVQGMDDFKRNVREAVPDRADEFFSLLHPGWATKSIGDARVAEIAEWLYRYEECGKYLCIDDEETYRQGQPLLRTNPEYGFQRREMEMICAYFLGRLCYPKVVLEL